MRLRDLDAHFIGEYRQSDPENEGHTTYRDIGDRIDGAQGLWLQCPKCAEGKPIEEENGRRFVRGGHGIICWFRNPRNAPKVPDDTSPGPGRWWVEAHCTGLDDLTFGTGTPPITNSVLLLGGCGWHGHITNGATTTC